MRFEILSRAQAEKRSREALAEPSAVISIRDPDARPAALAGNPQIRSVLRALDDRFCYAALTQDASNSTPCSHPQEDAAPAADE